VRFCSVLGRFEPLEKFLPSTNRFREPVGALAPSKLTGEVRMVAKLRYSCAALFAVLILSACSPAAAPDDEPSTSTTTTITGSPSTTRQDVVGPEGSVLVRLTGILARSDDGTSEICPSEGPDCAGIPLMGQVLEPADAGRVLSVTGWYDGAAVQVTASELPPTSKYDETDFSTPCTDLRGEPSVNPPDAPINAVGEYAETIPDRFAGIWWDRRAAVLTVKLTDDDIDAHRLAIEQAAGDQLTVCVVGGAQYSEAELRDIQEMLPDLIDQQATALWALSVDTFSNRVEVAMEHLDGPTRQKVTDRFGEAVVFHAFLEVLDGTIADLPEPVPAHPGNVVLLTNPNRASGGMDALGAFEIAFDKERRCVYFTEDEPGADGSARIVPVWPFGYTAESDPLRIYDHNGELVAEEGDTIQMGGGYVEYVTDQELCGAGGAWIMSSHPQVIDPLR
jgi:hypothetical protein